jgi:hypothetical protein
MDAATVRAMLEQHFGSSDPEVSHEMYHDDAVLEFPQSGERFMGVANFREWRSNYPGSTTVEFRQITGRDDLWVVDSRSAMTRGLVAFWSFKATRSLVSRSTSPKAGSPWSGGRVGGPLHSTSARPGGAGRARRQPERLQRVTSDVGALGL